MAACEEGVRLPPAVANIAHILLVISFHNELRKTTGGVSDPAELGVSTNFHAETAHARANVAAQICNNFF